MSKETELKVLYYLKRNQSKANGQCPVMGRITIGSSVAQFSLKVDADAVLWGTKAGRMKGKSKAATECNRQIEKVNMLIHTRYAELTSRQKIVKAEEVKNAIQGNAGENELLLAYCRQMNEKYALRVGVDRKPATYRLELSSYTELERFVHEKYQVEDVSFRSLTYSFIEDFNFHMRVQRKLKPNSAAKPLIFLNKAVRLAVREGIIKQNPFLSFKSDKSTATHKTLTREELDKLMNV
ncbi:MAG: phage integrase SAM-like domain-containing protein, partial [Tannerella sp.]|nr:phage integrase SAM-like domain-containing protein [Tannerella sp.]